MHKTEYQIWLNEVKETKPSNLATQWFQNKVKEYNIYYKNVKL